MSSHLKPDLTEKMAFIEGRDENNGKLLTQEITMDAINNHPVFWRADSIVAPTNSTILKNKSASLFSHSKRMTFSLC